MGTELETQSGNELAPQNGATIIPAFSAKKTLAIRRDTHKAEFAGVLARLSQYADIGHALSHIEKTVEYVVQIPLQYQKQFESGEYFINQNHTTGVEWPSLMRVTDKGQYRFVADLPIKQQEFVQGNPMHDLSMGFYNLAMQKQMAAIAEVVERTYKTVERIEHGQMDDRIALLNAGREGMILALTMTDEAEKMRAISLARNNLITAKNQIGNTLKRRAEEFEMVPGSGIGRFFAEVKHSGYLSEKDDEVEELQSYYQLYLEATKLLAASYVVTGEADTAQQAFIGSIGFMDTIDFSRVKSIEYAHKRSDLTGMFYRNAGPYLVAEKEQHIEDAQEYEYISLEVSGQELLEALNDVRSEEV